MKKARRNDDKKVRTFSVKSILITLLHWLWKGMVLLFLFSVVFSMVAIPLLIVFG